MALGNYFQFVLALAFVLALILAAAWLFRRFGRGRVNAPRRGSGSMRRLAVVEAVAIDTRRRMVLVRRDNREHLLILGPQGETVVETGIRIPGADADADADAEEDEPGHTGPQGPQGTRPRPRGNNTSFLRLVRQSTQTPS